jgi:neutral ceramidase
MKKINRLHASVFIAVALLLAVPGTLLAQGPGAARLRAGAAKVDITPDPSELTIATDSIRGNLYVRAIVVDDGDACAALVSADAGAVGDVDAIIARSSASTGCPAESYVIAATHTHSGSTGSLGGPGSPSTETISAAIISAVDMAKSRLAPARIGYGTAQLDLNVNRDLFNSRQEWRQEPNPDGASDKALAVVALVGEDDVPIGVLMNYGMHPINFFMTGVVSADFPGEASKYVEEIFDDRPVALFTQGASGDQNPRMGYSAPYSTRGFMQGQAPATLTVGPEPPPPEYSTRKGFNVRTAFTGRTAVAPEHLEAYQKVIGRIGDYVTMLGHMIGSTTVRVMREDMQYVDTAAIWTGEETFSCPGRIRLDADNPARENVFPGYKDGPDVNITVGLVRIGDIHLVRVNGEVYANIALNLKDRAPANKTVMVSLANGFANSGYIYSDDAYSHLTFQVIGSRLKPGCAEGKIISTAIDLMGQSGW